MSGDETTLPRTMHRVVSAAGGQLAHNIRKACQEAEADGMVMVGFMQLDEWHHCAVFVGAEELFRGQA